MKYHALFVILEKLKNLKLSSAANYRISLKGLSSFGTGNIGAHLYEIISGLGMLF